MVHRRTVALLLCALGLAAAQCGWELEIPKAQVMRINPQTKEFKQISVRDEIPIHQHKGTLDKIEVALTVSKGLQKPKAKVVDKDALFTGDASYFRWTVDGLTGGFPEGIDVSVNVKKKWSDAVRDYNKANPSAKLASSDTTSGSITEAAVNTINAFLQTQWQTEVDEIRSKWKSKVLQPPIAAKPDLFHRFSVKSKHYVHHNPRWSGYAVPNSVKVDSHNHGFLAILELKTQVKDGDDPLPWSEATLTGVRNGFNAIKAAIDGDDTEGTITLKVADDDHWIIQFNAGKKILVAQNAQFTYNLALEHLHSCGDHKIGWPAAAITDSQSQLKKNTQRMLLKQAQQPNSDDKNNNAPYMKSYDVRTPYDILKEGDGQPYATTVTALDTNGGTYVEDITSWAASHESQVDKFLTACLKLPNYAWEPCLAPYYPISSKNPMEVANSLHYMVVEERINIQSAAALFPFSSDTVAATVFGTYASNCMK